MNYPINKSYLFALLATLVSVFGVNRYRYPGMEQSLSVPIFKKISQPHLYQEDIFIAQSDKFYTYFWHLVDLGLQIFPLDLEQWFFAIYFFCTFLTFWAVILVIEASGGELFAALLAVFVLLFNRSFLGNDYFFDQDLDTVGPSRALIVIAWYFYLKGSKYHASVFHGLAFLVHPLSGLYSICMHLGCLVFQNIQELPKHIAIIGVLASPLIIWNLSSSEPSGIAASLEWLELIRLRAPDHVAPFTWPTLSYLYTVLMFGVVFLLASKLENVRAFFWVSTSAILLLSALGFLFSELFPISPVIKAQLFRATTFLGPFSAIVYALFLERIHARKNFVQLLLCLIVGFTLFSYSPHLKAWAYGMIAFAFFACYLLSNHIQSYQRSYPTIALAGILLMLGLGAYSMRGPFSFRDSQSSDWLAVQHWAKDNTHADSLFVVPPGSTGFRVGSERASFGSWFDGTILFLSEEAGKQWIDRMKLLGWSPGVKLEEFYDGYLDDISQVASLKEKLATENNTDVYLIYNRAGSFINCDLLYSSGNFYVYSLC